MYCYHRAHRGVFHLEASMIRSQVDCPKLKGQFLFEARVACLLIVSGGRVAEHLSVF